MGRLFSVVVVVVLALVGCGGKSLADGGNAGSAGQSAGGATSVGGSTSVSGATSSGGATSTGGAPPIDVCIGNAVPATPVRFQFQSTEGLWLRLGCTLEYTVNRTCKDNLTPIMTQAFCSQECGSGNNGCIECGACPLGASPLSQGNVQIVDWDGFVYTNDTSSSGCACYNRQPAASGTYQVGITAYLNNEDALASKNGYNFSTTFTYPAKDVVYVDVDFKGL